MTSGNPDDLDALKQTLIQLATIANQLDARSEQAVQRVEAGVGTLDQGVHRLDAGAERFAKEALRLIGAQVQQAVAQDAGQALDEFKAQLQASARAAQWAAQGMEEQRKGLARAQHGLVWKGLVALTLGSLLAAGGSSYLVWKNVRELERAEFGQDILHATQTGVLTRCGESLCARTGHEAERYGKDGEYVLLAE